MCFKMGPTAFLLSLLAFLPTSFSFAASENWGTPYDVFFERNDLKAEYSRSKNGEEKRSVTIPNQTRINQTKKDGKVSTRTSDISGNGAVLCAREIYLAVKTVLDNCDDFDYPNAQKELLVALEKIDKFVSENSIIPVSQEELKTDSKRRNTEFKDRFSGNQPHICNGKVGEKERKFIEYIAQRIEGMSEDEFKSEIEKLLSVPRLPVTNPCL